MSMRMEGSAEAVRPLKGTPANRPDWPALGLPETGWLLVSDKEQCSLCPGEGNPPCTAACGSAHNLDPDARKAINACRQCDPAPCEESCAAGAVGRTPQGVVEVDQEVCNGCKFCLDACEYGALLWVDPYQVPPMPHGVSRYTAGRPYGELPNTVAKCTFCDYRLLKGVLPVCVEACALGAIWVGNLDRNTVTNGYKVLRLSDLLNQRRFQVAAPGQRVLHLLA